MRQVWKTYPGPVGGSPVEVLRSVDWVVEPGERSAILGPSGCGKSTLLNLAGALDRPSAGEVVIAERSAARLSDDDLARLRCDHVGFVFQQHLLLPQLTTLENVLLAALAEPSGRAPVDEACALLKRVGLGDHLHHRPAELSGGERQRVAVARALLRRPKLLLADELTGSLDAASAASLADLLVGLNREFGMALVVATHSTALAARMRRRWRIENGCLVEVPVERE